jgi:dienelactone hydrolase
VQGILTLNRSIRRTVWYFQVVTRLVHHFVLLAAASTGLVAQFKLQTPRPTGAHAVGRTLLHLVDSGRDDPVSEVEGANRELMIVIWYPAEAAKQGAASFAPWIPAAFLEGEANEFAQQSRRTPHPFTLQDAKEMLRGIGSRSAEDIGVASGVSGYPVIIFEPGAIVNPVFYSSLCEDLASHGNVVIGVAPTGWIAGVAFSNEHAVSRSGKLSEDPRWLKQTALPLWAGDVRFAIDQVAKLNRNRKSIFYQRLDTGRIGAFGHSFGGTAAILAGLQDARVKAVVNLDGGPFGLLDDRRFPKPILSMMRDMSPQVERRLEDVQRRERQDRGIEEMSSVYKKGSPGLRVTITASHHMAFSDEALFPPWEPEVRRLGAKPGDGETTMEVIRGYIREFFAEFLSGQASSLLDRAPGEYGIAQLQSTVAR